MMLDDLERRNYGTIPYVATSAQLKISLDDSTVPLTAWAHDTFANIKRRCFRAEIVAGYGNDPPCLSLAANTNLNFKIWDAEGNGCNGEAPPSSRLNIRSKHR